MGGWNSIRFMPRNHQVWGAQAPAWACVILQGLGVVHILNLECMACTEPMCRFRGWYKVCPQSRHGNRYYRQKTDGANSRRLV